MNDWHHWEAGYILSRLTASLPHLKDEFINFAHHSPFSSFPFILFLVVCVLVILIARWYFNFRKLMNEESVLLEITPPTISEKSAYTTQEFFSMIHGLSKRDSFTDKLLGRKTILSFEIVSSRELGIRFIVRTTPEEKENIKREILSYLPHVLVKTTSEYIPTVDKTNNKLHIKVAGFQLRKHFAFPLQKQSTLQEHDPVAYITGMMTQLKPGELISLQVVVSGTKIKEADILSQMILNNEDILRYLSKPRAPLVVKILLFLLKVLLKMILAIGNNLQWAITELMHSNTQSIHISGQYQYQQVIQMQHLRPARILSSFEQEVIQSIKTKIDQELFEGSIRLLVVMKEKSEVAQRVKGFHSSLAMYNVPKYQSFFKTYGIPYVSDRVQLFVFRKRMLSLINNASSSLYSASEIADLYHFPFKYVTQTENIVKAHSKELPAPITLKNGTELDTVFGENNYAGVTTPIGLTEEERQTHMYILGRTGSGKTTLMFSMAKHDIEEGRGLAFIDPHGDVAEDLVASIPTSRKDDLIYINPIDLKYPIGINVMELTPGLDEDEAELEKEVVAEGVVSLFRKVFSKDESTNAHRIEYILRNTIYTAFTVPGATLFTINKIMTNPTFRKQVVSKLTDEDLVDFWKYEFGKAGDYQIVKMTQGITAKVGRFLRSPTAKRILEQEKSTINFDEIINGGKILICNFSQKLGEDSSRLMGTTIMTKLQQAALKRAYIPESKRKTFYVYVDEFQNFATQSFTKMITEGRKYRMPLIIAEQSTSQQKDRDVTNIILANVTTVISFRSGNYIDEDLMLNQFAPYLVKGEIMSLPRYRFYIKISAIESEEPFSGETIYMPVKRDSKKMEKLIASSRNNWAIVYLKKPVNKEQQAARQKETTETKNKITGSLPDDTKQIK